MRKIVRIDISAESTTRGNPKYYTFTLECGHTRLEFHGPYAVVRVAAFDIFTKQGEKPNLRMHCYACAEGKAESPKCKKTQLPVGIMTLGYCRQNCSEEEVAECTNKYSEWNLEVRKLA